MTDFKFWLQSHWYQKRLSPILWCLVPLAWIYSIVITLRRSGYLIGFFRQRKFPLPIIMVGNLSVGGTGKTPLVIHIAKLLKQQGMRPGIVSRGYKGNHRKPTWVYANTDPEEVGDEPVLLAKRLFCPIVVARNRPKAVQNLLDSGQVDVIISDDGLQHYALGRDIEIIVVDGKRRFGNGWCLPAGPLREPISRIRSADYLIVNTPLSFDNDTEYDMELRPRLLYNGSDPGVQKTLFAFQGQTVHAVAGIGFPDRFFEMLENFGLIVIAHPFPDHTVFKAEDIEFNDDYPVFMTEKDAVKCGKFMSDKHWVVSVDAAVNPLLDMRLLTRLQELKRG